MPLSHMQTEPQYLPPRTCTLHTVRVWEVSIPERLRCRLKKNEQPHRGISSRDGEPCGLLSARLSSRPEHSAWPEEWKDTAERERQRKRQCTAFSLCVVGVPNMQNNYKFIQLKYIWDCPLALLLHFFIRHLRGVVVYLVQSNYQL